MKKIETHLKENNIIYAKNHNIAPYTSFKLGGIVKFFICPINENQLISLINLLKQYKYSYFILGNGTNVLFKDKPNVKVVISLKNMPQVLYCNNNIVVASSNINLFEFNKFLKDNELSGFEFSFGIPATIGGAIKGNAGAFDDCVCNHLSSVTILNTSSLKIETINKENIKYNYRKTNISGIILKAEFSFKKGSFYEISALQNKYLEQRRTSQPYGTLNAGSIFKRGKNYIPAKLIDQLGLKGFSNGGAQVSQKHAGFIIKYNDNCSSEDVLNLIKIIKEKVKENYNINLKEEIIIK